jgi:hypothetical protein
MVATMAQAQLTGRFIWIEMNSDKSATMFAPRKGKILDVWEQPSTMEWALVRLDSPFLSMLPFPRRVNAVVLKHTHSDPQAVSRVFHVGHAWVEVLRTRRDKSATRGPFDSRKLWRLGFADIFPWPKPEAAEFREMIRRARSP